MINVVNDRQKEKHCVGKQCDFVVFQLSQTDNFDERRKIRARLRAVREEKSGMY